MYVVPSSLPAPSQILESSPLEALRQAKSQFFSTQDWFTKEYVRISSECMRPNLEANLFFGT